MASPGLVIISVFFLGIIKGSAICSTVCGPALIPYIVIKRKSPWEALKLTFLISIPRLLLFSLLGGIVGYLVYNLSSLSGIISMSGYIHRAVYIVFGIVLIVLGFYLFAKSIDERSDFREGKNIQTKTPSGTCNKRTKDSSGILARIMDGEHLTSSWKENGAMLLLGWGMAMGCLAEVTLVEGTLFTGAAAFLGDSAHSAVILGFSGMFVFALGLTVPLLVLSVGAAHLSGRINTGKSLNIFKTISSFLMMCLGTSILIFYTVL